MIHFSCPRCKTVLNGSEERVGEKIACPKCQQRLQIPGLPRNKTVLGIQVSTLIAQGHEPAASPLRQGSAANGIVRKWKVWIVASAVGIAIAIVAFVLLTGREERGAEGSTTGQVPQSPLAAVTPQGQASSTQNDDAQASPSNRDVHDPAKEPLKEPAKKDDQPPPKDKSSVIAEGIGTTADESLKDAFRNAVRQFVGTVVDAETLVKDDQIISNKVLTYSDGFIKTYDEISKVQDKGLFKTQISATVERRSVVAKLKAANVTLKDVDGKGIFAEIITDLEAATNAKELLGNALEGFPQNVLEAEAIGKPKILERSPTGVKVSIHVQFKANGQAYDNFVAKLRTTLNAIARGGEGLHTQPLPNAQGRPVSVGSRRFSTIQNIAATDPAMGQIVVAVQNGGNSWDSYAVDDTVKPVLASCCHRKIIAKLSLLRENGEVIAAQSLQPADPELFKLVDQLLVIDNPRLLTPTALHPLSFCITSTSFFRVNGGPVPQEGFFLVGPLFFDRPSHKVISVTYSNLVMPVEFKLTLDQIKAVNNVKCELM